MHPLRFKWNWIRVRLLLQKPLKIAVAQGAEREEILRKHLRADYEKGYRGTAWGLHGISEGLTPAQLAVLLEAHGEYLDPCAERETFDHSLMG